MKYLTAVALFVALSMSAEASEVTGTVTTGVSTGNGVNGIVVTTPVATPGAGQYGTTQNVVLSGGPGTQSIHYTIDGSSATCLNGNIYLTPIIVAENKVLEAVSCYANSNTSPKLIAAYIINPPTPAPGGGGGGRVTTPETVANDFNDDGSIDIFDFNILMANWGMTSGATHALGDVNDDGAIDIFDFNLLIAGWQS